MDQRVFIAYVDDVGDVWNAAHEYDGGEYGAVSIGQDTYMLVPVSMTVINGDGGYPSYQAVPELQVLINEWLVATEWLDGEDMTSLFSLVDGGPDSEHTFVGESGTLRVYNYNCSV